MLGHEVLVMMSTGRRDSWCPFSSCIAGKLNEADTKMSEPQPGRPL
jgi:hypothetical protein